MANIEIEHKRGPGVWPWILGLLVAALLVWAVIEATDDDGDVVATDAGELATPVTEPVTALVFTDVIVQPISYLGRNVEQFEATVAEVVSDRGFWVERDGQRMFVVLNEGPPGTADTRGRIAERPHINAGDMVRISQATVRDASYVTSIAGPLDDQTRSVAGSQQAYLVADEENVDVLTG